MPIYKGKTMEKLGFSSSFAVNADCEKAILTQRAFKL